MHTHRRLPTFKDYPGGVALASTLVTIDIQDAEGAICVSLRTDLHHTQVQTPVFWHQTGPHCSAWGQKSSEWVGLLLTQPGPGGSRVRAPAHRDIWGCTGEDCRHSGRRSSSSRPPRCPQQSTAAWPCSGHSGHTRSQLGLEWKEAPWKTVSCLSWHHFSCHVKTARMQKERLARHGKPTAAYQCPAGKAITGQHKDWGSGHS